MLERARGPGRDDLVPLLEAAERARGRGGCGGRRRGGWELVNMCYE